MVITIAKLRMANASMHGARKPPGPKIRCLGTLEVVQVVQIANSDRQANQRAVVATRSGIERLHL